MTARPDFVAGNTRLRARRPDLLGPVALDRLRGLPAAELAVALRATPYRPHFERRPATAPPAESVLAAVDDRLRDTLRGVAGAYEGVARDLVGLLLARHDLADTLALLRGAVRGVPAAEVTAAVLGVGRVAPAPAADVAAAGDPDAAVARLVGWRLPDPATAAELPRLWLRYELHDDLGELEHEVAAAAMRGWDRAATGPAAAPLAELLADERDEANLLLALAERAVPGVLPPRFLPGGSVPPVRLDAVARGELAPAEAGPPGQQAALARWAEHGDPRVLQRELRALRQRRAAAGFLLGDPLGAAVPVAYVLAAEAEADALRDLVRSALRASPLHGAVPEPARVA